MPKWANHAAGINAKANRDTTSADRQTIWLSNGEEISARLVALANGLNIGLRQQLGITREIVSPSHSISIGFDIAPVDRANFEFPALSYYFDRPAERMAYLTLFPIGSSMRANLFGYRDLHDPWLQQLRQQPQETLFAAMRGLRKLTGNFAVTNFIKIRPVDLYISKGHRQAGIVLVGDAFATSCPAAGTGAGKVFTDVERLCNVYIPRWLATAGMGEEKWQPSTTIPSRELTMRIRRQGLPSSLALDRRQLAWRARRWTRFVGRLGVGTVRRARGALSSLSVGRPRPAQGWGGRREPQPEKAGRLDDDFSVAPLARRRHAGALAPIGQRRKVMSRWHSGWLAPPS